MENVSIEVTPKSAHTIETEIIAQTVVAVVMMERGIVWLMERLTSSESVNFVPYLERFSRRRS